LIRLPANSSVFALVICDAVIRRNAPLSCPSSSDLLKLVFCMEGFEKAPAEEPPGETGYSGLFIKSIRVGVIIAGMGLGGEGEIARRAAIKALGDTTRISVSGN
jgi:hypothetical protein